MRGVCFECGRIDDNGFASDEFLVAGKRQYPLRDGFVNVVGQSLSEDRKREVVQGMVGQLEAEEFSNKQVLGTSPHDALSRLISF